MKWRLDHEITIESRTNTPDAMGQPKPAWTTFAETRAGIRPKFGREYMAGGEQAEATTIFIIRYMSGLDHTMRVVHKGDNYDIISIIPIGRDVGLELLCKALVD